MKRTLSKNRDIDLDPLSTSVVEDLLASAAEWKGVSDIVRLTLKAVTDVIRVQAASIKEINNMLPTRASKTELTTGLSLKANINDVSRTISQISNTLESRITLNELQEIMKDYISKEEFQDAMIVKGQINDTRYTGKVSPSATNEASRQEEIHREVQKRMGAYVSLGEFQELLSIVEQKANTSQLSQILQNKVSKQIFNAALQKLVPRNELEITLNKKVDITDLEYIVSTLQSKVDLSTIQKLTEVIENKVDKYDIEARLQQVPTGTDISVILQNIEEMKATVEKQLEDVEVSGKRMDHLEDKMEAMASSVHTKISHAETSAMMSNLKFELVDQTSKMKLFIKNSFSEEQAKSVELFSAKELLKEVSAWKRDKEAMMKQVESIQRRVEEYSSKDNSKDFRKELEEFKNQMVLVVDEKITTDDLEQVLTKWVEQIHIKIHEEREDTLQIVKDLQRLTSGRMDEHTSQIQRMNGAISKRQSQEETSAEEGTKRLRREIEDCRRTIDKVYEEVDNRLTQGEYETDLVELKKKIQAMCRDIALKSNIKDVCVLVDSKPNVDEVNKALKEIHDQLDEKVSTDELKCIITDQATINETLCSENIVGRWLWHSGQAKTGNLVPWEVETVNTLPDNFLWDKDQTSILTLASGLYEITVNMFCKYKPTISLLVNGDVVATRHCHQEKQNIQVRKKKSKEVSSSLKIREFFMLPTRARVSVTHSGEQGSEGFINIRRL